MWIRRLALTNFRNYQRQELSLLQGLSLVLGDNAQGKSNLLEAIFLLATTRSARAQTDGELIHWDAPTEPQPVARVKAEVERHDGPVELEVIIAGRPHGRERARMLASKRMRVNGVPRRQIDVVGQLAAVLFSTEDMELIGGPPGERRRYLDTALIQLDPAYARALSGYGKVVSQRNALLRRIKEGEGQPEELTFWDDELAREGAVLLQQRAIAIVAQAKHARAAHSRLSDGEEELTIAYQPRLEGWDGARAAEASLDELSAALSDAHTAGRGRDIGAGMTLSGPHRDDVSFAINGVAASSFASRGQRRTAALALRLAEARFLADRKGDLPVVLLDDVLSELDDARRRAVLASLSDWDQVLITSADGDRIGEELAKSTAVFRVVAGSIEAE